jgi:hypothetical protein
VGFVDTFPANLTNATAPTAASTCGGSISASAGGPSLGLSGGTIPANGSCTVSVDVKSAVEASYVNTIAPGGVSTSNAGGNPGAASATLNVGCQVPGYEQGITGVPARNQSVNTVVTGANRVVYAINLGSGEANVSTGPSASGPAPSNVAMTLSTTPGDFNPATTICGKTGAIGLGLLLHVGAGAPAGACTVTSGQTYYVNVRHVTGTSTCGQVSSCGGATCAHQLWNQ